MKITKETNSQLVQLKDKLTKWLKLFTKTPQLQKDKNYKTRYQEIAATLVIVRNVLEQEINSSAKKFENLLIISDVQEAENAFKILHDKMRSEIATIDNLENYRKEFAQTHKQWTQKYGVELPKATMVINDLDAAISGVQMINEFINERLDIIENLQKDLKDDKLTATDQKLIQEAITKTEQEIAKVLN